MTDRIVESKPGPWTDERLIGVVRDTWGYDTLRPMQSEAIRASLSQRDSLVVMPTGGGKSLCYQVPPLLTGELTVVVSPLIALMQDQVDGLKLSGYPAAALNSHVSPEESRDIRARAASGELKLLLIAPERLLLDGTVSWLKGLGDRIGSIAVDEAHCISQWGHDFRPEYRRLVEVRRHLPRLALHAYTATATPRVRDDIIQQLGLRDPVVLVGRFDRPNLTYRVIPRTRLVEQAAAALRRHRNAAAIAYCISRKETESLAASLSALGFDARAYHAGMTAAHRTKVSEDFRAERLNIVCATVAFGMGIDRSDVRCVIHAGMPKSVEHYQQETGRAGRDGLPSECVLLYSAADSERWRGLIERSAAETGATPESVAAQMELLRHMKLVASGSRCRHRALTEYFGQSFEGPAEGCGACDRCLGEMDEIPDAPAITQKVLSCVYRVGQSFGAGHVADVLRGRPTAKIIERKHNELSTFGLLRTLSREMVLNCIHQLVDAGALAVQGSPYPIVTLTPESKAFIKGERAAKLLTAKVVPELAPSPPRRDRSGRASATEAGAEPLSNDETALFESLRQLRKQIAEELGVPPYVVFGDVTLDELSRVRPGTLESLVSVKGIGRRKLEQFGERFLSHIASWCRDHGLTLDARPGSRPRRFSNEP